MNDLFEPIAELMVSWMDDTVSVQYKELVDDCSICILSPDFQNHNCI